MKNLSVKNLKKTTRTLYHFKATEMAAAETTTTTGGTDPTNTTTYLTTTSHALK